MAEGVRDDQLTRMVQSDPRWQQAMRGYIPPGYTAGQSAPRTDPASVSAWVAKQILTEHGVPNAATFRVQPNGDVINPYKSNNPLTHPEIMIPAIVGGGFALGALAPSAAAAAPSGLAADGTIPFSTAPGVHAAALSGTAVPGAVSASAPVGSLTAATSAGAGTQAGQSFVNRLTGGLKNPQNLAGLAGLVTSLTGGSGSGGSNNADLQRLQAITEARMRRVDPLHQAITSLAMSRLPTNMQRPVPDVPLPE